MQVRDALRFTPRWRSSLLGCMAALLSSHGPVVQVKAEDGQTRAEALLPRAAARELVLSDALSASERGLRSADHEEEELSERVPGLVRTSHETGRQKVERTVEEAIWRTLRPWQRQTRMRHARYWYLGRSIDAAIMEDGSVEVRPKEGVTLSLLTVMAPDSSGQAGGLPNARGGGDDASHSLGSPKFGLAKQSEGAAGGFGISVAQAGRVFDRLMTGKAQPNLEEREFMEQTQALREHLIAAAAARNGEHAGKRLDEKIRQIWAAPGPLSDKQAQIFMRWDQCAEDDEGARARARIEAFVRSLERELEACPYASEDLRRLNAKRESKRAFEPCAARHDASADAGVNAGANAGVDAGPADAD